MPPRLALSLLACLPLLAADTIESRHSPAAPASLSADPTTPFWRSVPAVMATGDALGNPVPGHATEIRTRWTDGHLYVLFTCPYERLHLKPQPNATEETNRLWLHDVAEVFVGGDFQRIQHYREFEVSPQNEWVDLDIDLSKPEETEKRWLWNSGFEHKARIDEARKVWYAEMKIPFRSIDDRQPRPGLEYRINFYRAQGPTEGRKLIAWQPTHTKTFHEPKAFGILRLAK